MPCQPSPAASPSGFSITGAVSTNTLSSVARRLLDQPARERLQRLLDRVVIVAALAHRPRSAPRSGIARERQRIGVGRIAHAERDHAAAPRATAPAAPGARRRAPPSTPSSPCMPSPSHCSQPPGAQRIVSRPARSRPRRSPARAPARPAALQIVEGRGVHQICACSRSPAPVKRRDDEARLGAAAAAAI